MGFGGIRLSQILTASHHAETNIGNWHIHAFNLNDGRRLLDAKSFKTILRVPPSESGSKLLTKLGSHPLLRKHELRRATSIFDHPIRFRTSEGTRYIGFEAEGLVDLCKFLLKAREFGALRTLEELRYAQAAEALLVSLANVGLAALIDEATGFQATRRHDALQALLEKFLNKELAAWAKRFPDEFYKQIFRLRNWEWQGRSVNPPQVVGRYTREIVYERLAPGIIEELERRNPVLESGERVSKHHQWLTDDIGHPVLAQHLYAVIALMKISPNWKKFKANLQEAFPRTGDQLYLLLDEL